MKKVKLRMENMRETGSRIRINDLAAAFQQSAGNHHQMRVDYE
jgi:hypothetical protein